MKTVKTKTMILIIMIPLIILLIPGIVFGDDGSGIDASDTAWMLIATALVMLMLPGLAFFYGGMARRQHTLGTMMHSIFALGLLTIQWIVIGYSLSFGGDIGYFIGNLDYLFLNDVPIDQAAEGTTIPALLFVAFQGMFAIITPALITGAFAERMKFSAYIVFMLLWATLVYDPICHWVWGGGWLGNLELLGFSEGAAALDFAGGTVVHISSGISGLIAALYIGKRMGYPEQTMLPHNVPFTVLGAGLLWFGWFGFNAGSALSSGDGAALAFITTHIAAGVGAVSWAIVEKIVNKKVSMIGVASGVVAGLVGITPAAGYVGPMAAVAIGAMAGVGCYLAVLLKQKLGYDDSLDAFGVHGVGGTIGALATGIFAAYGGGQASLEQFGIQALSVGATIIYAVVVTFILLFALDKIMGLRVTDAAESEGLDRSLHGEAAYH